MRDTSNDIWNDNDGEEDEAPRKGGGLRRFGIFFLVLVAVLAATEQQNGTWQKGRLLWLLPQVLFIGYAAYQSMGMFLCVALLWVLETLFLALRQDETKKRNQVPFSQKRENKD